MKKIFIYFLFIYAPFINSQELKNFENFVGYVPSSIREKETNGNFKNFKGDKVNIDLLKLNDFNVISTTVTVTDQKGKIGGFGITFEKDTYKILYTFENYIELFDSTDTKYRIGASIEVEANISTNKKNLNLSDLFSLAINADKNNISGSITMNAKGFSSNNIYGLFNINSSIDASSVQQILKNVGIMISKFTEQTINLKPIILGYEHKLGKE